MDVPCGEHASIDILRPRQLNQLEGYTACVGVSLHLEDERECVGVV